MTKKIIVAFDTFKGCMSATEACDAAAEGIHSALPDTKVIKLPLSDGGEGLVECVKRLLPTAEITLSVYGPLMEKVVCEYAMSHDGKTAYMEMAAASGITLVPQDKRNPMNTTTYGVGEMIADAIGRGCETIVMGIGGSATCDAGEGMLRALKDKGLLHTKCNYIVACDVTNPLYGEQGAAYVFAPQKGATPEQVRLLDQRLRAFANKTVKDGIATAHMADFPGAGAAGGLGYAFLAYLNAKLQSGIDTVLDIAGFDEIIKDADIVITGEGKSDVQTLMGKAPYGVQKRCISAGVVTWLLSGAIDDPECVLSRHFANVRSINENDTRPLAQLLLPEVAKYNLKQTVKKIISGRE